MYKDQIDAEQKCENILSKQPFFEFYRSHARLKTLPMPIAREAVVMEHYAVRFRLNSLNQ